MRVISGYLGAYLLLQQSPVTGNEYDADHDDRQSSAPQRSLVTWLPLLLTRACGAGSAAHVCGNYVPVPMRMRKQHTAGVIKK